MKLTINHKKLQPTTKGGYAVEVKLLYQSMNKAEIDELENEIENQYGSGTLVIDFNTLKADMRGEEE